MVTDNSGVVAWINGTAFGAVADMTTIEGAGTTISPFKVKDLGIITTKLADNAVTTIKIADANVTNTKLANDAVNTAKILDGTIANADISPSAAIAYSKLNLASSIVVGDLADNAVETDKIKNGAVETAKLADGSITTVKLANDAVNTAKILDGTIATVDLSNDAVINTKIANDAVEEAKIKNNAVTTVKLSNDAVEEVKIKNDAVTSDKIKNNTILDADISNTAAIQTTKIKGFYMGTYTIPSGASGGGSIFINVNDLIPLNQVYLTSAIIFQCNSGSTNLWVKSSEPTDSDGNGTYDQIYVAFNTAFTPGQKFSFMIILNN